MVGTVALMFFFVISGFSNDKNYFQQVKMEILKS
jgi:hypothetical protein